MEENFTPTYPTSAPMGHTKLNLSHTHTEDGKSSRKESEISFDNPPAIDILPQLKNSRVTTKTEESSFVEGETENRERKFSTHEMEDIEKETEEEEQLEKEVSKEENQEIEKESTISKEKEQLSNSNKNFNTEPFNKLDKSMSDSLHSIEEDKITQKNLKSIENEISENNKINLKGNLKIEKEELKGKIKTEDETNEISHDEKPISNENLPSKEKKSLKDPETEAQTYSKDLVKSKTENLEINESEKQLNEIKPQNSLPPTPNKVKNYTQGVTRPSFQETETLETQNQETQDLQNNTTPSKLLNASSPKKSQLDALSPTSLLTATPDTTNCEVTLSPKEMDLKIIPTHNFNQNEKLPSPISESDSFYLLVQNKSEAIEATKAWEEELTSRLSFSNGLTIRIYDFLIQKAEQLDDRQSILMGWVLSLFRDLLDSNQAQKTYFEKIFTKKPTQPLQSVDQTFFALFEGINHSRKYIDSAQKEFIINTLEPYEKKVAKSPRVKELKEIITRIAELKKKVASQATSSKSLYKEFLKTTEKSLEQNLIKKHSNEDCFLKSYAYTRSKSRIITSMNQLGDNLMHMMNLLEQNELALLEEQHQLLKELHEFVVRNVGGAQLNYISQALDLLQSVNFIFIPAGKRKRNC